MTSVSRRDFLKKVAPVLAGAGLVGVAALEEGRAQPFADPAPSVPRLGSLSIPASYLIFKRDGKVIAQNGATGFSDYSDPNPSVVIQKAIDALTDGGLIYLKRGVYTMTQKISVGANIHLLGEKGTILRVENGAQTSRNSFNVIEVDGEASIIQGLEIDGNADSNSNLAGTTLDVFPPHPTFQCGILTMRSRIKIVDCHVHDTWNAGVWVWSKNMYDIRDVEIAGCIFERCGKALIDPSSSNPPQSANSIYVFFGLSGGSGTGGSTARINVHDNWIIDSYGSGVYYHFTKDSTIENNTVHTSLEYPKSVPGIVVDDTVENIIVRGNNIKGYGPGIIVFWFKTRNVIIDSNLCADAPNAGGFGCGIVVDNSISGPPVMGQIIIKGNICHDNALSGVEVSASNVIISGNICYNNHKLSGVPLNQRAGIFVHGAPTVTVREILISGNRCFDDQNTPTQRFGIALSSAKGGVSKLLIANNNLGGNGSGGFGEMDASEVAMLWNDGHNLRGIAPIEVGASPFVYTNIDGVPEAIYIQGGNVSNIARDSVTVFTSTPATLWLGPGESITVTFALPPVILKDRK